MTEVRFLFGTHPGHAFEDALNHSSQLPAWRPFDPRAMAFVGRFSQLLLTMPAIRQFPEMAALGHWFRAANLREMAKEYPSNLHNAMVMGRGLAFHLAPANVDSVFMYSWLISLLAGNTNIVRVSQKASPQLELLVDVLGRTLAEEVGEPIKGRAILLTYPHDDVITRAISQRCMVRVVWGGDATVATIRAIALRPTATELCFPDRFSLAAINSTAVQSAAPPELEQLARKFYNDTFWFAQQACSSPRLLAWVGSAEDTRLAQQRFWAAVDTEVQRKEAENTPAMNMARLTAAFEYAAAEIAHPTHVGDLAHFPQRISLERPMSRFAKELHCGNGMFLEQRLDSLPELGPQLTDKEQTLAVYGFQREVLEELVLSLPPRAVDRIVPIGDALAFAPVWDGQDLVIAFTKKVTLPPIF